MARSVVTQLCTYASYMYATQTHTHTHTYIHTHMHQASIDSQPSTAGADTVLDRAQTQPSLDGHDAQAAMRPDAEADATGSVPNKGVIANLSEPLIGVSMAMGSDRQSVTKGRSWIDERASVLTKLLNAHCIRLFVVIFAQSPAHGYVCALARLY